MRNNPELYVEIKTDWTNKTDYLSLAENLHN